MNRLRVLTTVTAASLLALPSGASAETREQYLERLREVCEVDCPPPKQFRRAARKRANGDESDMAVIMDVANVRRAGTEFELLSMDLDRSLLVEREILGSAGINISGRNGVGGLPRGRDGGTHPNLIIVAMDQQTLFDILNMSSTATEGADSSADETDIIVEGEQEREVTKPTLAALRSYFRNRKVVVRGTPRLQPVLIGARRDFRRKQVTLELDNASDLVLLPRYDENGNPKVEDLPWLSEGSESRER